jgi:hypothetical protein
MKPLGTLVCKKTQQAVVIARHVQQAQGLSW